MSVENTPLCKLNYFTKLEGIYCYQLYEVMLHNIFAKIYLYFKKFKFNYNALKKIFGFELLQKIFRYLKRKLKYQILYYDYITSKASVGNFPVPIDVRLILIYLYFVKMYYYNKMRLEITEM